ncbi:MAG: FmdB family transcriptional regulator [Acidimicrobiia bacterium]
MPTYEYRCSSCGEHVEVFQSFSDDPLEECGICGGKLTRVFHPVGIVFKGSGFYSTDSRSNSSANASSASSSSSEGTSQKSGEVGAEGSSTTASTETSDRESKIA